MTKVAITYGIYSKLSGEPSCHHYEHTEEALIKCLRKVLKEMTAITIGSTPASNLTKGLIIRKFTTVVETVPYAEVYNMMEKFQE